MGFLTEKMKEARGRPVMMGSSFVTALFNTAVILIIARNTGPEFLGALGFMLAFIGLFFFVGDLGYGLAFERVLAKGYRFADCYRAFMMAKIRLTVYMGVLSGMLIAVYYYFMGMGEDALLNPMSMLMILGYFIMANLAAIWVVSVKLKGRRAVQFDFVDAGIRLVLLLGLLFMTVMSPNNGLMFQISFIYLVSATIGMMLVRNIARSLKKGEDDEEIEVEFLDTSKRFIPYLAFTALLLSIDKVALWLSTDFATVGIYFGAQRITIFIAASAVTIELLLGEAITRYVKEGRTSEISETLRMTERYVSLVVLPVAAFYVIFSESLLNAFLGDQFIGAGVTVGLMAGAGLFTALASPHMSYLVRSDRTRDLAIVSGAGLATFAGILALLLPDLILPTWDIHGINGAALAVLASSIVMYACARYITWKTLGCKPHTRILAHFLSAGIMMAVIQFMIWYFDITLSFPWLLSSAILGFFVYVLALYLTGEMVRKDYHEFRRLTKPE